MIRVPNKGKDTNNVSLLVEMRDGHCWNNMDITSHTPIMDGFLICMKPGDDRVMMIPVVDIAYIFITYGDPIEAS